DGDGGGAVAGQLHVYGDLGITVHLRGEVGQRLAAFDHGGEDLERRDDAVARRALVEGDDVSRGLAAEDPAALDERLKHVAVANRSAVKGDLAPGTGAFEAVVGHHGAGDPAVHAARGVTPAHHHEQRLVAVDNPPFVVDEQDPVAVAVEHDADVGAPVAHDRPRGGRMGRTAVEIDVEAVRLVGHGNDFGAELLEHVRGDVIGGAVGAVDHDPEALEREMGRERALAELDVAAGGIRKPLRLAEEARLHGDERNVHHSLYLFLDLIRQLAAGAGKEL